MKTMYSNHQSTESGYAKRRQYFIPFTQFLFDTLGVSGQAINRCALLCC